MLVFPFPENIVTIGNNFAFVNQLVETEINDQSSFGRMRTRSCHVSDLATFSELDFDDVNATVVPHFDPLVVSLAVSFKLFVGTTRICYQIKRRCIDSNFSQVAIFCILFSGNRFQTVLSQEPDWYVW